MNTDQTTPVSPFTDGFTLLEVLVTIVIISVGMLGLAGLQARGLQNNHSSLQRTLAVYQAYDMADRMRANIVGVNNNNYDNLSGTPSDPGCITSGCTPAQLTDYDMRIWNLANASLLPNGVGVVCRDSSPEDGTSAAAGCDGTGTIYAIKLWWSDDRSGTPTRFVMSFRP